MSFVQTVASIVNQAMPMEFEQGNTTPPTPPQQMLAHPVMCNFGGCHENAVTSLMIEGAIQELCAKCAMQLSSLMPSMISPQEQLAVANPFAAERMMRGDEPGFEKK